MVESPEETELFRQIALRLNDTKLNYELVSVNQVRHIVTLYKKLIK